MADANSGASWPRIDSQQLRDLLLLTAQAGKRRHGPRHSTDRLQRQGQRHCRIQRQAILAAAHGTGEINQQMQGGIRRGPLIPTPKQTGIADRGPV